MKKAIFIQLLIQLFTSSSFAAEFIKSDKDNDCYYYTYNVELKNLAMPISRKQPVTFCVTRNTEEKKAREIADDLAHKTEKGTSEKEVKLAENDIRMYRDELDKEINKYRFLFLKK